MSPRASVVVLGYGEEAYLEACLRAAVDQLADDDELVLVDNGVVRIDTRRPSWPEQVRVVGTGENTGFAGGCLAGAAATTGEVLVFVNSDAILRPGAVGTLVAASRDPGVGVAGGCLRLADQPDLVNSAGNPLHYTGITWAGGFGDPASAHARPGPVAVATGGLFAVRRDTWDRLGGFDPVYVAYHEDTDLSVRAWLAGLRVIYVPDAVADHHYEFGRSPHKMYLVERNRLITVLTDFPAPLLRAVLPALVLIEPALLVQAVLQGWGRQKVAAWGWLLRHRATIRTRRAAVQAAVPDPVAGTRVLAGLLSARVEPPMVEHPPGMSVANAALAAYWRAVRPLVVRRGR